MKNPFKPIDFFQPKPGMYVLARSPLKHGIRQYRAGIVADIKPTGESAYNAFTAHGGHLGTPNDHYYLIQEDVLP